MFVLLFTIKNKIINKKTLIMRRLLLIPLLSICLGVFGQVTTTDFEALQAIYNATNGPEWKNSHNWNFSENNVSNNWYGVKVERDRVVSFNLAGNNLVGEVPKEVGQMDGLRYLNLSNNRLNGNLQYYIGKLSNLVLLDLSANDFDGDIPETFTLLTQLEYLSLADNNLTGKLPFEIGQLVNLREFYVNYNQLSGAIPQGFENLLALERVNLSLNMFEGGIPRLGVSNLQYFNIESNFFTSFRIPYNLSIERDGLKTAFNHLTFANILPHIAYMGNFDNYSPQYKFPLNSSSLTYNSGQTVTLNATTLAVQSIGNSQTLYQWFKNGVAVTSPSTNPTITFAPITTANEGVYFIQATHPQVPGLTLQSDDLQINVLQVCGNDPISQAKNIVVSNVLTRSMTIGWTPGTCGNRAVFVKVQNDSYPANPAPTNGATYTANPAFMSGSQIGSTGWYCVYNGTGTSVNVTGLLPYRDYHIMVMEYNPSTKVYNTNVVQGNPIMAQTLGIVPQDFAALKALYKSTNGGNWQNNTNWDTTKNNVSARVPWYGITRGATNANPSLSLEDRVVDISLTWNNLVGAIPTMIGNLSQLKKLNLNANKFSGLLPVEIGNLSLLYYLDLGAVTGNLSGSLPDEIGNLSHLQYLNIGGNKFSGSLPVEIGNLSQLHMLLLNQNDFSGSLLVEIGNLSQLQRLNLSYNNFSGTLPVEIGNLSQLEVLYLYHNNFSGSLPAEIGNLSQLQKLGLSYNNFSGSLPPEIWNLFQLNELNLENNNFSGSLPAEIGNLNKLTWMILGYNNFSGSLTSEIGNLSQVQFLTLHNNNFSGSLPTQIGNLSKLQHLNISDNNFSGILPAEIANLVQLTDLRIGNNYFTTMPDLSDITTFYTTQYNGLLVGNNNLTFHSLEPNRSKLNYSIKYSPQRAFSLLDTAFTYQVGSTITLNAKDMAVLELGGSNNRYSLYKNEVLIQGPSSNWVFTIPNANALDAGTYTIKVKNEQLTELVLSSVPFTITINSKIPVYIEQSTVTDVNENALEVSELVVFPNPTQGNFNLKVSNYYTGEVVVVIKNSLGQVVKTQHLNKTEGSQSFQLNLNGSSGMYFAEVIMGNQKSSVRFVKN
jgi:Leucine-rich repeat (LRR) protein